MTIELTMLALSIVLGLVQITLAAQASTRQRGADWTSLVDWHLSRRQLKG